MILPHRPQQSAKRYELIWNQQKGSPLDWYTKRQAQLLAQMVDEDTLVDYAYSYFEPLIPQALEKLNHLPAVQ